MQIHGPGAPSLAPVTRNPARNPAASEPTGSGPDATRRAGSSSRSPRALEATGTSPSQPSRTERTSDAPSGSTPADRWAEATKDVAEAEKTERPEGVPGELTPEERKVVEKLRARDAEVRAHEAAHAGIGGGTPTYTYQRGPDGQSYAVGGEVSIDVGGGGSPQETIAKMQRVRAAALAPANPSAQDRSVAALASRRAAKARADLARERAAEFEERGDAAAETRQNEGAPGTDGPSEPGPTSPPVAGVAEPEAVGATQEPVGPAVEANREPAAADSDAEARPGSGLPVPEGHSHVPGQDCPHCAPRVGQYAAQAATGPEPEFAAHA